MWSWMVLATVVAYPITKGLLAVIDMGAKDQ